MTRRMEGSTRRYRGTGHVSTKGYIRIQKNFYVRYGHRIAMEQKLGRPLEDNEHVHHMNGVKTDNRPENLELVNRAEHARHHMSGRFSGQNNRYRKDVSPEVVFAMRADGGETDELAQIFNCSRSTILRRIAEHARTREV
jgi:hypothetical protein